MLCLEAQKLDKLQHWLSGRGQKADQSPLMFTGTGAVSCPSSAPRSVAAGGAGSLGYSYMRNLGSRLHLSPLRNSCAFSCQSAGAGNKFALLIVVPVLLATVSLSSCGGVTRSAMPSSPGSGAPDTPLAGILTAAPTNLSFGNIAVGSQATQNLSITNTGAATVSVSQATITGTGFNIVGPSASSFSIPAGQISTIQVQFVPQSAAAVTGNLSVVSNASNSPLKLSLSGTGTAQGQVFNVVANATVPDSKEGYHCAIAAGSSDLVCQDVTFANGDATHSIVVYGAVANVSTTSATAVFPGSVSVAPESMANIAIGTVLYCANADGSNGEQLVVSGINGSTFTATFATSKTGTWNISSNYLGLYTVISSVTNPSTVVLAAPATQTVNSGMVQIAGATDNFNPIQNTINMACSAATVANPSTVFFPAGIYGLSNTVFIPNGCSYLKLTAGGQVILLETANGKDPTHPEFGQGAPVLAFGYNSAPGTATAALANNTRISAGSNVLWCGSGCGFTTADIGQPLYLDYAGDSGLPLWTTITGVSGSPTGGVYPAVRLANNAQTTLPLTAQGLFGPGIVFGYKVMQNIDIGGIDFHNMGYWFHPKFTYLGRPVVQFGTASQVVKQGLKFHDSTLLSATNGCLANNGPNAQFSLVNVTCLGMADAAFYLAGSNSNVTIENVVVDNTQYPVPNTPLTRGFMLKRVSHALIEHPIVRCNCFDYLIAVGDFANFDITIKDADLDGEDSTSVAIGSNLTTGLTVLNAKIQNIKGNAFRFANADVGGIQGITITGTSAFNIKGGAIWINDGSGTGHGPSNIIFENNNMQVSGNGIHVQNVEGTNHWSGNQLVNVPSGFSAAVTIVQGKSGATNFVNANTGVGFQGPSHCDLSCVFGHN